MPDVPPPPKVQVVQLAPTAKQRTTVHLVRSVDPAPSATKGDADAPPAMPKKPAAVPKPPAKQPAAKKPVELPIDPKQILLDGVLSVPGLLFRMVVANWKVFTGVALLGAVLIYMKRVERKRFPAEPRFQRRRR